MSFLSPLFLVGAATAAIPLLLHFFHRRAEVVIPFAATRYLQTGRVEQASRRRVREWLLLALRTLALVLLAVAFARPYLVESAGAAAVPPTVVLVDVSASMTAPGQFERARQEARRALADASASSDVALVSFGAGVNVIAPLSPDTSAAMEAVSALQPGAGATRIQSALIQAAELLDGRAGRVVVVTDLQASGWNVDDAGSMPPNVEVTLRVVPRPATNAAVTSLRVEKGTAVATVRNYSAHVVAHPVVFGVDGQPVATVTASVAPGGVSDVRAGLGEGRSSGTVTASIHDGGGYSADDTRYAVIEASNPVILIVSTTGAPSETLYLSRALSVVDETEAFQVRALSGIAFADRATDLLAGARVVFLSGTRGIDAGARQALGDYFRSGGRLFVTAADDVDPGVVNDALSGLVQTSWAPARRAELHFGPDDSRHPVFRVFGGVGALGNVTFDRASTLTPGPESRVLARFSDGTPALVEDRAGAGVLLTFASDLNRKWNDFPVQPAFLPFVHEVVRYLIGGAPPSTDLAVGDLPGAEGQGPGVVAHTVAGHVRRVAVNVDARESDPAAMTEEEFAVAISRMRTHAGHAGAAASEPVDRQRLWQYGLALMLLSLAAESVIGRRTV